MDIRLHDSFKMGETPGIASEDNHATGSVFVNSEGGTTEVNILDEKGVGYFSFVFSTPGYATIFFDTLSKMVKKAEDRMKSILEVNP